MIPKTSKYNVQKITVSSGLKIADANNVTRNKKRLLYNPQYVKRRERAKHRDAQL